MDDVVRSLSETGRRGGDEERRRTPRLSVEVLVRHDLEREGGRHLRHHWHLQKWHDGDANSCR